MGTKLTTGLVRLSYAHIFTAHSNFPDVEPMFSVQLLIPKSDVKTVGDIQRAIKETIDQTYPNGKIPPNFRNPLRDGDGTERPEAQGHWFLNARSREAPGIVDRNRVRIIDSSEVYSGCYCLANISFFCYNNAVNRGCGCGLNHLMKIKNGPSLGGRGTVEEAFNNAQVPSDPTDKEAEKTVSSWCQ